jgi:hypothetical protein
VWGQPPSAIQSSKARLIPSRPADEQLARRLLRKFFTTLKYVLRLPSHLSRQIELQHSGVRRGFRVEQLQPAAPIPVTLLWRACTRLKIHELQM